MNYKGMALIFIMTILVIHNCQKSNDTIEEEKSGSTIPEKESIQKDSLTVNDTMPKRIYRKDLPKTRPDTTPYFADYEGYRYYFPCGPCRDRFIQDKEKYLEEWIKKGRRIRKRKL